MPTILVCRRLVVDGFLELHPVVKTNHERWNVDTLSLAIVCHDQTLCILKHRAVNHNSHQATKRLHIQGLHDEMAGAPINKNNRAMILSVALIEMLLIELVLRKWQTSISVCQRIVQSSPNLSSVIKVTKVAQRRSHDTLNQFTIDSCIKLFLKISRMHHLELRCL